MKPPLSLNTRFAVSIKISSIISHYVYKSNCNREPGEKFHFECSVNWLTGFFTSGNLVL
jgi:hypothetical protein